MISTFPVPRLVQQHALFLLMADLRDKPRFGTRSHEALSNSPLGQLPPDNYPHFQYKKWILKQHFAIKFHN